jgi:hypothetical protein
MSAVRGSIPVQEVADMAGKQDRAWSVAGAARSARETRIATVRHLREAPIARLWQMTRLQAAYQLHASRVGHSAAAQLVLFGGMGYRPPYPADWQQAADLIVGDEARYLSGADLYILTPQMCDVVIAAAQSLTVADLELLSEDDLPSVTGLVVLPHPVIVRAVGGDLADDRAFTWRFPSQIQRPGRRGRGLRDIPAVRMSVYHDSYGPVRPDSFLDFAAMARAQGTPLPPLLLDAIRCVPIRYTPTAQQTRDLEAFAAAARTAGQFAHKQAAALGLDEDRVIGEYTTGEQIDDRDDTFVPRFLYAFWRLCEQRIAEVGHAQAGHSARVLADRAGVPADVRVVRLRRTEQAGDASSHAAREWQHRWIVRMHKIRQWYPSLQRHKVIYRGPYIKGPDDKPLLGGEVVRALIR